MTDAYIPKEQIVIKVVSIKMPQNSFFWRNGELQIFMFPGLWNRPRERMGGHMMGGHIQQY
jgi:hypothetical protein